MGDFITGFITQIKEDLKNLEGKDKDKKAKNQSDKQLITNAIL